jgi:hypothetical protein
MEKKESQVKKYIHACTSWALVLKSVIQVSWMAEIRRITFEGQSWGRRKCLRDPVSTGKAGWCMHLSSQLWWEV